MINILKTHWGSRIIKSQLKIEHPGSNSVGHTDTHDSDKPVETISNEDSGCGALEISYEHERQAYRDKYWTDEVRSKGRHLFKLLKDFGVTEFHAEDMSLSFLKTTLRSNPNVQFEKKELGTNIDLPYLEHYCRSEARVWNVRHPNIGPSMVGFLEQAPEPMPFLLYPRCANECLLHIQVLENARLPVSTRLSYLLDALYGLKYLHNDIHVGGKPVVHGNLSQYEIMVSKVDGHTYLRGFGARKYLGLNIPQEFERGPDRPWMPPEYVGKALEGWRHQPPVTEPPGDIWLFGCTMMEVFVCSDISTYFEWSKRLGDLIGEIKGMRPEKPDAWTIDDGLWEFIMDSCLAVDPAKRITAANAITKMENFLMRYQVREEFQDWSWCSPDLTLNNLLPIPDSVKPNRWSEFRSFISEDWVYGRIRAQ